MIPFAPVTLQDRQKYLPYLQHASHRGCAYSFVNQYLWGRQFAAMVEGMLVIFSQYNCKSVYLFPCGEGDPAPALAEILADARERGIPCRFAGLSQEDCALLERMYPGKFRCHFDRDAFEYVYDINDLADLSGRKYQKKRNHLNRFRQANPEYTLEPIGRENMDRVKTLIDRWYQMRQAADPHSDFVMEQAAVSRALRHWEELELPVFLPGDLLQSQVRCSFRRQGKLAQCGGNFIAHRLIKALKSGICRHQQAAIIALLPQ